MDAVEDIKSRLAVEDIVGEYVELKRAGRNLKGLSPFGNEKTPSFMVSPEKQIWHDFSSGKGGDMFSFVMEMEGLDFKGTLELLARKAGVDLDQYRTAGAGNGQQKERLLAASELAARFYQVQLKQSQEALEYLLKKRQFTKETVLKFRLGYAPNNGTALLDFLRKKDFTADELQKAGLATKRYRGLGDMFRGRIMVPLADQQGNVIGFTARLLEDIPNAPKYLNTPQTSLYDKGRHVYGLHLAKEAIRKEKYAVVVEGNLDVIASHQADVTNVVATAGTAMTERHLKAVGRFAEDVRLAFDQDNAGLNAAERTIPLAGKAGVSLSIITIPAGKDPDELVRKDPEAWRAVIQKPQYALDWLIERHAAQLDLSSATGKRQFTDIILKIVRQIPDQVEQDHYLDALAKRIEVSKDALTRKLTSTEGPTRRLKQSKTTHDPVAHADRLKAQSQLLALTLMQPALRHYLKSITTDMLLGDEPRELLKFLEEHPQFSGDPKEAQELRGVADYVKILSLQFEELYQGLELLALRDEATRLQTRLIEQYVKSKKQPLIEAMRTASETESATLLTQAQALDALLKKS